MDYSLLIGIVSVQEEGQFVAHYVVTYDRDQIVLRIRECL